MKFTAALNRSNLRTLDLTGNTQLGDAFLTPFLVNLRPPHLRELGLSVLGLTAAARSPLVAFLASGPARPLKVLKLNGNALDLAFVDDLLDALAATNFSLVHVEVYANRFNDRPSPAPVPASASAHSPSPTASVQSLEVPSSLGSSHYSPLLPAATTTIAGPSPGLEPPAPAPPPPAPLPPPKWEEAERLLRTFFQRNRLYATITARQATRLLPYARARFLRTARTSESQEPLTTEDQSRRANANANANAKANVLVLPAELQIAILHHLVPALSPAQCHRVCRYVSRPFPPSIAALRSRFHS
jgi:hypothetical protein